MIFFDIDGTMLDHALAERNGALAFHEHFPELFPIPPKEFVTHWRRVSLKHDLRYLDGELTLQGQRRARLQELAELSGHVLDDRVADEMFPVYLKYYEDNWSLFDDVLVCLDQLKDYPLGVISNGHSTQQRYKLERTGIADRFSTAVISGDIETAKPDSQIFLEACRCAAQKLTDCVYIGDRLETDAIGARDAGLRGVWLDRTGFDTKHPGITNITSLTELPGIL